MPSLHLRLKPEKSYEPCSPENTKRPKGCPCVLLDLERKEYGTYSRFENVNSEPSPEYQAQKPKTLSNKPRTESPSLEVRVLMIS